jgi:hypothetical protein
MKPLPPQQVIARIDAIEQQLHAEWEREPPPAVPQVLSTEPERIELNPVPVWAWLFGVRA